MRTIHDPEKSVNATPRARGAGFTLIELMITVVVVAILASIALPSYQSYLVRASRQAAQGDLLELAALQEKIYLNSNAYASSVSAAYTGQSSGGLGRNPATTRDAKYNLAIITDGQSFTITATPVIGGAQAGDGNLSILSDGKRVWGSGTW